ncbi:MAG: GntR family transcriptional regulator [Erysipelotrichaceae bacterium]
MNFDKIESPTLTQLFIDKIETMILNGELKVNDQLPSEREIANQMGVSRSVVNNGLVQLAKKGFLEVTPRQKTIVADYLNNSTMDIMISIMKHGNISHEYIYSTLTLRKTFMDLTLDTCFKGVTPEIIANLEEVNNKIKNTRIIKNQADLLFQFDDIILTLSNNVLLPILLRSFKYPNTILFERYITSNNISDLTKKNDLFIQALKDNNIKLAKDIMDESIDNSLKGSNQFY